MAVITITEADLAKASTYIPIESKDRIARIVAAFCVEPADGENGAPVYRENRKLRQMFLMGILAEMYLHRDYRIQRVKLGESGEEQDVRLLMQLSEYDDWAGSHVVNQLERLKKDKTKKVSNTVYDLLYDYKAFEGMIFGAIRDELEARNDALHRAAAALCEITPDLIRTAVGEIREAAKNGGDAHEAE